MLRSKLEQNVRSFHHKFQHPSPSKPQIPSAEWRYMRINLVREECEELVEAMRSGSLVKIAREAVDMIYVCFGVLIAYGLPVNACWGIIHRANMIKDVPEGNHIKPIKGTGWIEPDTELMHAIERSRAGDAL
jgi:predicted HAD superfamily Cof-like phosphohydrolase